MPRQSNPVDFWRGFALITIFINHIPGVFYERFTHKNLSLSDSAELFVFLAGWSLRHVVGRPEDPTPFRHLVFRLGGRALTLYAAHLTIVMIAIAMLAASSRILDNPLLLEWHNAAAVFANPVDTHIGLVLLSHQLGYFDILPLYVVLLLLAPLIAVIHRKTPSLLLPLSVSIYLAALVFKITVPTWPTPGQWFFNPLCWQLVFVLGFAMSRERGPGGFVRANISWIRWVAAPILAVATAMTWFRWLPDPTLVPEPKLLFIVGKTFVTPPRLIQFLALIAVASLAYPYIVKSLPTVVGFLSMLGRNSMQVFCVGSVLSLAWQIVRFYFRGGFVVDTALVISGILVLGVTAWLSEWRSREVETAMTRFKAAVCRIVLAAGLLAAGLHATIAQERPETGLAPVPKLCETPGVQVAPPSHLPAVAGALKERKRINILAIGATAASLHGPVSGDQFAVVEKFLEANFKGVDVTIVHRGVSGELAADAAERIRTEVALNEADLVLWQLGTADALAQVPIDEFRDAVTRAVEWMKGHKIDVILVGLRYSRAMSRDKDYQATRQAIQQIAREQGVLRLGIYEAQEVLEKMRRTAAAPVSEFAAAEADFACLGEYLARAIAAGLFMRDAGPAKKP